MPSDSSGGTQAPALVVRPLGAEEERLAFARLAAAAFFHASDVEAAARGWVRTATAAPDYDPARWRGAFREGAFRGGYILEGRTMRAGAARLPVGCVGSVIVLPTHRRQGIARTLLGDALRHGRERGLALLLLNGIANFYQRLGYTDVLDYTEHRMRRDDLLALPASAYAVRWAEPDDAASLLRLYERHYGPYTGSFVHTLAWAEHFLRARGGGGTLLACDASGTARGYAIFWWGDHTRVMEGGADDWEAARALLRRQAELTDAGDETLVWHLPPDAPTLYQLADHLHAADTSAWGEPSREGSIHSVTYRHPDAGWMARIAEPDALITGLAPAWNARLAECACGWEGQFTLDVGGRAYAVSVRDGGVTAAPLAEGRPGGTPVLELSEETLTALVFGYRPLEWAMGRPGSRVPKELWPLLRALFPVGGAWIAGSDEF